MTGEIKVLFKSFKVMTYSCVALGECENVTV